LTIITGWCLLISSKVFSMTKNRAKFFTNQHFIGRVEEACFL